MHLTAQTLTIIGIPLLGIPALIIGWSSLYYGLQAANNLKPIPNGQDGAAWLAAWLKGA
jgi:hypothetical protein